MMHYGSWVHQGDLDSHHCYIRYMEEVSDFQRRTEQQEEETEQTVDETHDTVTSATSGDRSSSADLFRLEFAATQWSKLVSNAEGLFQKLMSTTSLPHPEQDQIEQWLCLKQEYEECIASDDAMSLPGLPDNTRRSLERIEEVTETDERTDDSANRIEFQPASASCSSTETEMSEEEDEDEEHSDVSSENPDFMEKLDECMSKFKTETDKIIDAKDNLFQATNLEIISTASIPINNNNDYVPIIKPIPIRNPNSRRNSMLPGSEMCNEVMVFNGGFRPCQNKNVDDNLMTFGNANFPEHRDSNFCNVRNENYSRLKNKHSPDLLIDALKTTEDPEPIKALKTLTMNNEVKQTQMKKIESDLDGAHKRIDELQTTIKIKERFIADMIKNSDTRTNAKQRFQRKRNKLEEEYYNTRKQLAQAENASMYKASDERSSTHKKEIELYKNMAIHYEKRLMDIAKIKQIAGDSAKKVFELESSLNSSKKQMEKLNRQLRREEERKNQLECELASDQKKIRDLEDKYNLTASKLKEMQSESEDERNSSKPKNNCSDKKKNFLEVSARLSHLEHVLNEKSMDLERTADTDEKAAQALRHEIENLRRTRDSLLQEKSDLDEKWQKERTLTSVEERKRLECGETIEAIDAMIEHKNEMICGRKDFDGNQSKREKSERMLMDRLAKLSEGEMRTLFYKYFLKVIDLKESSKCLETQNAELEEHVAMQDRRMRTMMNTLKQTKLEAERKIVVMQREQEEKLNLIYRHIAEETGSSGHDELDKNSELFKYKRENKILRRRLADVDALWKRPAASTTSPPRIPAQELKQIALGAKQTTKVTRQGRKLIWTATRGKNE